MKFFLILGSLVFVLSSLSFRAVADEVPLEEAIQPRTAESRWDYTSFYFEGTEKVSAGTAKEHVVEVLEIDGVKVYRIEYIMDWRGLMDRLAGTPLDPEDYSYFWEYFDEKGSYNFNEDFDDPQPPQSLSDFELTLPYPAEKGQKYVSDETDYEVIAVNEEITVPAGTFLTTVYEMTNIYSDDPADKDRQRYYMAPGVGLVRWEMDVTDENGAWVLDARDELFSYSLQKE